VLHPKQEKNKQCQWACTRQDGEIIEQIYNLKKTQENTENRRHLSSAKRQMQTKNSKIKRYCTLNRPRS